VPDADGEGAVYESELVAVEEVRRRFEARYASKAPA